MEAHLNGRLRPARLPLVGAVLAVAALGLPPSLSAQVALYGGTVKEHTVRSGGTAEGTIRLTNKGEEPRGVRLYQTDYRFNAAGESEYPAPGSRSRSNAGWISLRIERTSIAPGESVEIPYRIRLPDASATEEPSGSYWSMIMVEVRDGAPEEIDRGVSLGTQLRYGVQVATHVGDSGSRELEYSEQAVRTEDGERRFALTVRNTGTRALRPEMGIELYDGAGQRLDSRIEQRGLLYPGTSLRQVFPLGDLEPGSYEAMILADPGRGEVFAGQYRFDVSR